MQREILDFGLHATSRNVRDFLKCREPAAFQEIFNISLTPKSKISFCNYCALKLPQVGLPMGNKLYFDRSATVPSRNPSYAIPHTGRCDGVASAAPHRCTSGSTVRFGRDEPPSPLRPGNGRTRLAGAGARPQCYHRGRAVKSRQPGREPCMSRVFYIAS